MMSAMVRYLFTASKIIAHTPKYAIFKRCAGSFFRAATKSMHRILKERNMSATLL